jgi:hypothetical protein
LTKENDKICEQLKQESIDRNIVSRNTTIIEQNNSIFSYQKDYTTESCIAMSARGVTSIEFKATRDGDIGIITEITAEPWHVRGEVLWPLFILVFSIISMLTLIKAAVIRAAEILTSKYENKCKCLKKSEKIHPRKCISCWGSRKFRPYEASDGCCQAWSKFFHNLAANLSYMNLIGHALIIGKVCIILVDMISDILYMSKGPFYRRGLKIAAAAVFPLSWAIQVLRLYRKKQRYNIPWYIWLLANSFGLGKILYNPDPWDEDPDSDKKRLRIETREGRLQRKDSRN